VRLEAALSWPRAAGAKKSVGSGFRFGAFADEGFDKLNDFLLLAASQLGLGLEDLAEFAMSNWVTTLSHRQSVRAFTASYQM
jgi:hypothetical protein